MERNEYLTAQEAASVLGIKPATLYSYVSRGLIRSEAADESKRTRRYRREDIQKLKDFKEGQCDPAKVAGSALHWGLPVLESAITLIDGGQFYYRGQNALHLAQCCTVEQVAALIWAGALTAVVPELVNCQSIPFSPRVEQVARHITDLPPVERFQILLPLAGLDDPAGYDLRPLAAQQTGARILHLLAAIAVDNYLTGAGLVEKLRQGWGLNDPQAAKLINAALILCADHELNVSSFTARCVASAGAALYDVVAAGLAALQGVKHGRVTERVEAFLREAETPHHVPGVVAGRLRRGEEIPGFGHQLYPAGDPRGKMLFDLIEQAYPALPVVKLAEAVMTDMARVKGEHPNVDFCLVVLAQALNLPPGGAIALFALGRTIGWIGQAIEQYQIDKIIRPRAHYTGQSPASISRSNF
jgi:citrate synthase